MQITFKAIEAFLALEETLNFSAAASRCHMSASAYSQLIGRLEDQLGVRLFDRNTRKVTLTREGITFSFGAHRIAAELRATVSELRGKRGTGRVTIATIPTLAARWLPKRMAEFGRRHPGITLRLRDLSSAACLEAVRRGDADFSVDMRRRVEVEFECRLLFEERLHVLCGNDDPLTRLEEVHVGDLQDREVIQVTRTSGIHPQVRRLLTTGQVRESGFEVSSFSTVAGLVASGFGISIIPYHAIGLFNLPELAAIPLTGLKSVRPISLIRLRGRSLSDAAESMWEMMQTISPDADRE
ncbi:MAG: transcriptional regulator, LysR-family [Burkholderiales bacterium]|jgi:DNA-binding transcriptional LysR family regulator|nr:transcriptional regulator, LysR-family [Burkholderiales bacterium]